MQITRRMDKVVIRDYYHMDNNGWIHESDDTNTFIVNLSSKP